MIGVKLDLSMVRQGMHCGAEVVGYGESVSGEVLSLMKKFNISARLTFRLNKEFEKLGSLSDAEKSKVEFLCNECCWFGCNDRKVCYESVSRKVLGEREGDEHMCHSPDANEGYVFQKR